MSDLSESIRDSDREIFLLPNHSKFAVECNWNSYISQKVKNLEFYWQKLEFFQSR